MNSPVSQSGPAGIYFDTNGIIGGEIEIYNSIVIYHLPFIISTSILIIV